MAGYGKDLEGKPTLTDLVNKLARFSETRLRFSSFEMGTISVELLEALKSHPNFCPFFHLSLQSGSNNVLKKMNRHYTFDEYLSCVELIRKYFPNAGISTDIIVGFPTETDEDFNECLENVKRAKFTDAHIFPFSKREGTVAGGMPIINGEIIKTRVKRLEEVTNASKTEFLEFMKGKTEEVLIEEEKDGYLVGFTKNYIKCYIDTNNYKNPQETTNKYLNSVAQVKLTEIYKLGMKGELI
jgi:threonylcarbamoyladenosine tRNA methylthiotransferase MtaB